MVELGDYVGLGWFMGAFGYMSLINYLLPASPLAAIVGTVPGIFILFLGIGFQELYGERVVNRAGRHIYAYTRFLDGSARDNVHLYYKNVKEYGFEGEDTEKVAELTLGRPHQHPIFGFVNKVYISFWGDWSKRFHFVRGRAPYYGMWVVHNNTDMAALYEMDPESPLSGLDIYQARGYPIYRLIEAGGDLRYMDSVINAGRRVVMKARLTQRLGE